MFAHLLKAFSKVLLSFVFSTSESNRKTFSRQGYTLTLQTATVLHFRAGKMLRNAASLREKSGAFPQHRSLLRCFKNPFSLGNQGTRINTLVGFFSVHVHAWLLTTFVKYLWFAGSETDGVN